MSSRETIDDLLEEARSRIDERPTPGTQGPADSPPSRTVTKSTA